MVMIPLSRYQYITFLKDLTNRLNCKSILFQAMTLYVLAYSLFGEHSGRLCSRLQQVDVKDIEIALQVQSSAHPEMRVNEPLYLVDNGCVYPPSPSTRAVGEEK